MQDNYVDLNFFKMQHDYVNMCLICVNNWLIYVNMQNNYVDKQHNKIVSHV